MRRELYISNTKILGWLLSINLGFLISCQTIELEEGIGNTIQEISGKIVAPETANLDLNSLTVFSNIDKSQVEGGAYGLKKDGLFTALYVTNASDEVVMMGFQYPRNPTNEINSTTTALGLILMAPIFFDLTEEGKLKLIDTILQDSNFPAFKTEIEKNIIEGRSLFDLQNTSLIATLKSNLKSAGLRVSQSDKELPVNLFKSGKNFTFNNSGKSYSTIIGIYKGTERVKKLTVEGVQIFSSSLADLLTGSGGTFENPVDQSFTISSDGDYTFKFRTGKPGEDDGSLEHTEAFYENLGQISIYILSGLLPQLNLNKAGALGCLAEVKLNVINSIFSVISKNTKASFSNLFLTIAEFTVNNMGAFLEGCGSVNVEKKFFGFFLDQLKMFSIISSSMNTGVFGAQWSSSEAVRDMCYIAKGNVVTASENCSSTLNELVINGDFSSGNSGFTTNYNYCNLSNCLFSLTNNGYSVAKDASTRHNLFKGVDHTDGNGLFMIVNGSISSNVVWKQTLSVSVNTNYDFEAWVCTLYTLNSSEIIVKINGEQLGSSLLAPSSVNQWTKLSRKWNSGSSLVAVIEIYSVKNIANGNDFGLDDISLKESG
jgi:hypothetical protein